MTDQRHSSSPSRALFLSALSSGLAAAGVPRLARGADLFPVIVGVAPTDATAEAYYGHDNGIFAAAGLDIQLVSVRNTGAAAAALGGGAVNFVSGSLVPVTQAYTHGLDFRLVVPAQIYDGRPPIQASMGVPIGSPIKTAAGMNGKTVAVNGIGDLTHLFAMTWMDANGGDHTTVKYIEIPFPGMAGAFEANRIDAAILVEPFMTALKGKVTLLGDAMAAIGKRYLITGYTGSQAWLDKNRDTAKRFAAAVLTVGRWANDHHPESADILSHYTPLSIDTIHDMARAVYATTPIQASLIQPVLDMTTKYFGGPRVPGANLIWAG
jgi:NitT/TauT family transport system substrate-binding protein